jgi:hypothetical protein
MRVNSGLKTFPKLQVLKLLSSSLFSLLSSPKACVGRKNRRNRRRRRRRRRQIRQGFLRGRTRRRRRRENKIKVPQV